MYPTLGRSGRKEKSLDGKRSSKRRMKQDLLLSFKDYKYLGQFQGRIGHYSHPKKESNYPNLVQKANNKKGIKLEQAATPKVTDHPLPNNSRFVVEFNFEKKDSFPQNHSTKP